MLHAARQPRSWLIFDVGQKEMHKKLLVSLLIFASAILHAAELEFVGYLRFGSETRFVIANSRDSSVSSWLSVGEKFQGYTIIGFDAKEEVLSLSGSGGPLKVHLKPSKASPALPSSFRKPFYLDVTPQGIISIGQERVDIDALRKILRAAVAADPEVAIILRASVEVDATWLQSMFRQIREIAESEGARGAGLISKPPNKAPEPTPMSVAPRATKGDSK